MSNIKDHVWVVIVGMCLLWIMAGCSSRLETSVLSEKPPPEPEVIQPPEEPLARSQPSVSDRKIGAQDLGQPASEIPIERPAEPVISRGPTKKAEEAPQEDLGEKKLVDKSGQAEAPSERQTEASLKPQVGSPSEPQSGGPLAAGIPPVLFDPESPTDPTVRGETSEDVAVLETESVDDPGKPDMISPGGEKDGLSTSIIDPELPTNPTLRGEQTGEIAELEPEPEKQEEAGVKEEPLKVVKVAPGAKAVPSHTLADVYFDYDRFSLREDATKKLDANAQLLVGKLSNRKVVIEGHCDERGTQSYNMILGERRAQAVKKFLVDLGVPEKNLEVISLGKEKPFCTEHSMNCWQENRRGHFVLP